MWRVVMRPNIVGAGPKPKGASYWPGMAVSRRGLTPTCQRLDDGGGGVLAGREDAVDVGDLQPGIAHGVGHCLHVQAQLALVRQGAHLVGFVHAHDAGDAGEVAQVGHGAHRTGWNSGRVTSSVSLVNTTSTGMSHRSVLGSASTLMRFDSMRGPSASSTMARTYGGGTLNALLNDW